VKPIVAQDQARLGVGRCVRLAVSGMSYRLLRSGITTAILALAVAFLVHVLTHAILAERVQRSTWEALGPRREASRWMTRLTTPDSPTMVIEGIASGNPAVSAQAEHWAGLDGEAWDRLQRTAWGWTQTRDWFGSLSSSESAVLLGGQTLLQWFDAMQTQAGRETFHERLTQLNLGRSYNTHASDAGDWATMYWSSLVDAVRTSRQAQDEAIRTLRDRDPRPLLDRLDKPKPETYSHFVEAGFKMTAAEFQNLRVVAKDQKILVSIQEALNDSEVAAEVVADIGSDELLAVMSGLRDGPPWWGKVVGERVDFDDLLLTATAYTNQRRWSALTHDYQPTDRGTPFGLPVGTLWLVGLSLLVCVVGVTNALLMSVTERFNEIATMKCLGAMDRSIMQMFVAEAVIQGVLGGVVGVALGLLLTLLRGFAEFGTLLGRGLEGWADLLGAAGLSLGVGVILAALAAVGPSWIASRLAPMEAMRVE